MNRIIALSLIFVIGTTARANPLGAALASCLHYFRGTATEEPRQSSVEIWRPRTKPPRPDGWSNADFSSTYNGHVRVFTDGLQMRLILRFESSHQILNHDFALDLRNKRLVRLEDEVNASDTPRSLNYHEENIGGAPSTFSFNFVKQKNGRALVNVKTRPDSDYVFGRAYRALRGFTRPIDANLIVANVFDGERTLNARAKRGVNFELVRGARSTENIFATGGNWVETGGATVKGRVHRLSFILDDKGQPMALAWP